MHLFQDRPPKAVILAAGRGVRLGPLTQTRPKCLLDVGTPEPDMPQPDGGSLLSLSLDSLEATGVQEVLIITGHAGGQIRTAVDARQKMNARAGLPDADRLRISTAEAPDYVARGSMGSLLTAIGHTAFLTPQDPALLVLESDILYDPAFLNIALAQPRSTVLTAPLSGSGDEVYVTVTPDGQLDGMSKRPSEQDRPRAIGEFAGISLLTADCLHLFADRARQWLAEGRKDAHYEEVLIALAGDGMSLFGHHCPDLPWTEVDNADDLARARDIVWPQLRRGGPATG